MMITNLDIRNFRGIKVCNIDFPVGARMLCLIGAGDSTKSTILKAIEWILYPTWNLMACDSDFYNCKTDKPIVLSGTFTEVPDKLKSEGKFGMYLRCPNVGLESGADDEPKNGQPLCLTIRLTIDDSLEPRWEVVCNRGDAKPISHTDRKLLAFGIVGAECAKDMTWGKYSVLQKYADAKNTLHNAHTAALREVANHADLSSLDSVDIDLKTIGEQYGVNFENEIRNRMIVQNGTFSSSVGLFDGETPLNRRGLGSQRLLSMGLNINVYNGDSLLLIDEIENSLEPFRLRALINELRDNHNEHGQIIMTTHSPIAVSECILKELMVVHSNVGETTVIPFKDEDDAVYQNMQAQVRRNPEAFLCRRLIVCEGKTEMGFIRAVDRFLRRTLNYRMAYMGVSVADGGGSIVFDTARVLHSCGYDICVLMDSDYDNEKDRQAKKKQKECLRNAGISTFGWDEPNAIEEQVFHDVSTDVASELLKIAVDESGLDSVCDRLLCAEIPYDVIDDTIRLKSMTPDLRRKIGNIAKGKAKWYKRIGLGERMGNVVFDDWNDIDKSSKLYQVVESLMEWVMQK